MININIVGEKKIPQEIWKPCNLYENYLISNFGNIKHIKRNKNLKYSLSNYKGNGYPQVKIYLGSKLTCVKIHKLVMLSFKLEEHFDGAVVNHIDGNKLNNNLDNLEWCTASENQKHAYKNNLLNIKKGTDHNKTKLNANQVKEIRTSYKKNELSMKEMSKKYNISYENIRAIVLNKIWKHITI